MTPYLSKSYILYSPLISKPFECTFLSRRVYSIKIHYNQGADLLDYLKDSSVFDIKEGYVSLLEEPGLGIEIDEEKVKEATLEASEWKNPIWRNEDGSVTEW